MAQSTENISKEQYGYSVTIDLPYDKAVEKTKAALKDQGFGVLAEIDVKRTMKEKLNADFERYVILGACNPPLAHQALTNEPLIGLLLPCNVIVREVDAKTSQVAAIDAKKMLSVVGNPGLDPVAEEVNTKLKKVLEAL
ncbi:MAG: DUF302 domain-containing protein [Thermoanaerobaculia bacterium]